MAVNEPQRSRPDRAEGRLGGKFCHPSSLRWVRERICVDKNSFKASTIIVSRKDRPVRPETEKRLIHDAKPRSARGVYGISVASELSGIAPQTLRLYERWGLLTPDRTDGGTRRYSDDDLARLKRISDLVGQGINLAGVVQILDLEDRNTRLELDNTALRSDNTNLRARHGSQARNASPRGRRGSDHDGCRAHRTSRRGTRS
jgi:MerR family transcriptional regulator/heat shock protein HspR